MGRVLWLVILALPIWAAVAFDAPKWLKVLVVIPFFVRAATLGDAPDEHLLGQGFSTYRPTVLVLLGLGGLVLGGLLLIVAKAMMR